LAADPNADLNRDLTALEVELKKLETEYGMFFAGRLKRPPWETRSRVENAIKRLDRTPISNYGVKFRFTTLQTRYYRFIDLWDRALRAREEGRPGPFMQPRQKEPEKPQAQKVEDRIVRVATISDPTSEETKLHQLYEGLMEARQQAGQPRIAYEKFADLVKTQVSAIRTTGGDEVAFRVALKDGKVSFSARALRGAQPNSPERRAEGGGPGAAEGAVRSGGATRDAPAVQSRAERPVEPTADAVVERTGDRPSEDGGDGK
jgi:hypothetical protein